MVLVCPGRCFFGKTNVLKIAKMMKNHREVTTFMPLLFFWGGGEFNRQWRVWMSWISMQQKCLNQQQLGDATVELEASNAYDEHLAHHVNKIHSYFTGKSEAESFLGKLKIVFNTKTCGVSTLQHQFQFWQDVATISSHLWSFGSPSQLRQHDQILNPYDCSGDWSSWCGRDMKGKVKIWGP